MGKLVSENSLKWFEDLLFKVGNVFSLCRDVEADIIKYGYQGDPEHLIGEPAIAVAIARHEDAGILQRVKRVYSQEIMDRFGTDVTISHEAWHYFLAYIDMKRISSDLPTKFFLSTAIRNYREVETPRPRLEFELRITTIKPHASQLELDEIRLQIADLIRQLNRRSRYLWVTYVETGYASSRARFAGEPDPIYVPLPF